MKAYLAMKRPIDFAVAAVLLVLTAPLQAAIAILVRRNMGAPVIFRQRRPGKDEVIFELRKFRTMWNVDEVHDLITDEDRLTPLGQFLRSTSLDELPTLWNVLRGDMSLVGPRPLLIEYLPLYSDAERRRHKVRPGITGLAQVSGRNHLSWPEKFHFDLEYIDNVSARMDLKILALTAARVVFRQGISADGHVTAHRFSGCEADQK